MTEAWVTSAKNETFALGALVLGKSLRQTRTTRKLHALVAPAVGQEMREHLSEMFDAVTEVNMLDPGSEATLVLKDRPELGVTFIKLHCWLLTQYTKCVFLDADCLVIKNSDELFDYPNLSALPLPLEGVAQFNTEFNSGVFVFVPSHDTFTAMVQYALMHDGLDGSDKGFLNKYFSNWIDLGPSNRLDWFLNLDASTVFADPETFARYAAKIKVVHFRGAIKPWHHSFDHNTNRFTKKDCGDQTRLDFLDKWWTIFADDVTPMFPPNYDFVKLFGNISG